MLNLWKKLEDLSQKILMSDREWKKDKVIIKFKNRKQKNEAIFKQKKLRPKGEDLLALQFGQLLFINKSMCFKNQVAFS